LRLLESGELPDGWLQRTCPLVGLQQAKILLLFTDADASTSQTPFPAHSIAQEHGAALVSFSPEQIINDLV